MKTSIHLDRSLNVLKADEKSSEFFGCTLATIVGNDISLLFNLKKAAFPVQALLSHNTWPYQFSTSFKMQDGYCSLVCQVNLTSELSYVMCMEMESSIKSRSLSEHIFSAVSGLSFSESNAGSLCLIQQIIGGMPGRAHFKQFGGFTYQYANLETLKLLGMTDLKELIHLSDFDVAKHMKWRWPGSLAESIQELDRKVIDSREPIISFEEAPYFDANNNLVSHLLTKIPVYSADQTPLGIVTFAIDATQNKDLNWLRNTYVQMYPDKKLGFQLFLENIGIVALLRERNPHHFSANSGLSERQFDTLVLITHGKTVKECARVLGISNRTVEQYVDQLREKFNCNTKSDLATVYHQIIHQKFLLK